MSPTSKHEERESEQDRPETGESGSIRDASIVRDLAVPVILPLSLLVVLTLVFRLSNADIEICRLFYQSPQNSWPFEKAWICEFMYKYGPLPGVLVGAGGLIVGLVSFIWNRIRPYRAAGLFLAAALALGPGLLINGLFKPHWGRPRPYETVAFGGDQAFLSIWEMGKTTGYQSFPSGHASMGFYLMTPAFLVYRRHRILAGSFALLGLSCGLTLGITRILQGCHFPSDVLWSAGFVYLTGLGLAVLCGIGSARNQR